MAVTIKCPDCGHTEQSADGASKTCPECEGTMAAPPKKKYQAKSTSLEDEERARKKARPRDEDDERPKARKVAAPPAQAMSLDDDEGDDEKGGFTLNGKAAEQLELPTGFKNRALMKQVEEELSRGEVLHFVCRPSEVIAKKKGLVAMIAGAVFALLGVVGAVVILAVVSDKVPWYVAFVPLFIAFVGGLIAVLGPIMSGRQARLGWYAVTDRRAVVFNINLWGKEGQVQSYTPAELRKMWIKKSYWLKGGGDLIFKTEVHDNRTKYVNKFGKTVKETGTRTEHHYGFLGVADVKDVESLIHEVLLSGGRSDEDDD